MSRVMGGARAWVGRRTRTQRAGAVAGVALVATAPFGGLEPVRDPGPAPVETATPFDVGPFEVTIERAVSIPDLEPVARPDARRNRLLGLVLQVHNTTDRPELLAPLREGVLLSGAGIVAERAPEVFIVQDGSTPRGLNPGMGEEMVIILEHAPDPRTDSGVPEDVRVDVVGYEYVEDSPLTLDEDYWRATEVVASSELPVVEPD